MSQYSGPYTQSTGEPATEPSTSTVAREEAADLGQHARQAGGQVTQTARDQARQVVTETGQQARDLLAEARDQARGQASAQQRKAAEQLRSVADELGQMAGNGGQSGLAAEFARQAAGRLHGVASWLDQREPADLLDEARDFARRRPGTFLLGAAVAGLAAGRLTRGLTASSHRQPDTGQGAAAADGAATRPLDSAPPAYPAPPVYPADPVYPAPPAYPADPGYVPDPGYAAPGYPADPAYPPGPAPAPRAPRPEGTGW